MPELAAVAVDVDRHPAMDAGQESGVRNLLIDAERQAAGDFGKPGVDLAQSQRRPVFDAEGFHLVRHRATRRIEGGVEAVHEAIEALFPLVGPVAGQALVMLHIGDRLGPGELEKPLVLAPILL